DAAPAAQAGGTHRLPGQRALGGSAGRSGGKRPGGHARHACRSRAASLIRLAPARIWNHMTDHLTDPLALAEHRLLAPGGLDLARLDQAFSQLMGPGVEHGDLYFQHSRRESWTVEDGIVKDGSHAIEQGVGVRAISGERTGFA